MPAEGGELTLVLWASFRALYYFAVGKKYLVYGLHPTHWARELRHQIIQLPFNREIAGGTLPWLFFKAYLKQDALYLKDFKDVLKIISGRLTKEHHQELFMYLAEKIMLSERKLQSKYLGKAHPGTFFAQQGYIPNPKNLVVHQYTQDLFAIAKYGPIEQAVTACVPCFLIYNLDLGEYMKATSTPDNPYRDWINSYSSPWFTTATTSLTETMFELTSPVSCPTLQKAIYETFIHFTKYEYDFLRTSYAPKELYRPTQSKILRA